MVRKKTKVRTLKGEIYDSGIIPYAGEDQEDGINKPIRLWKRNAITFGTGIEPMYKTPTEMLKAIKKYFAGGFRKKTIVDRYGYQVEIAHLTITDLCIYLGFASRSTLVEYENKEVEIGGEEGQKVVTKPFQYIIKRAKLFIEREYEELLRDNPAAAMFALRSYFKWEMNTGNGFGLLPMGGDSEEEKVVVYIPDNGRIRKE